MGEPFVGSAAVAAGDLTRHALRTRYEAVHRDVYVRRGRQLTARDRAAAAYLWSRGRGVVAGQSAAAMLGAKWVDPSAPAQLLFDNRRPPPGIRTWSDTVAADEVIRVGGLAVTTPARTALDLACRHPPARAVPALDGLPAPASRSRQSVNNIRVLPRMLGFT